MYARENTADVGEGTIQWSKVSRARGARFFGLVRVAKGRGESQFKKSQGGIKFMVSPRQEEA